jgi:integrase
MPAPGALRQSSRCAMERYRRADAGNPQRGRRRLAARRRGGRRPDPFGRALQALGASLLSQLARARGAAAARPPAALGRDAAGAPGLGGSARRRRAVRERVARPAEARAPIEALGPRERAIYAAALYAGLRRGELQALRWEDVDFDRGVIRVERSWDRQAGAIEPKSRSGRRRVPLTAPLRSQLIEHRLRQGHGGEGNVFTNHADRPFSSGWVAECAQAAWERAGLESIGLGVDKTIISDIS